MFLYCFIFLLGCVVGFITSILLEVFEESVDRERDLPY